jgi:hypothetical protein
VRDVPFPSREETTVLQAGSVVFVGRAASVQFAGDRGFNFRIIRKLEWSTYYGWVWLQGYALNAAGNAVERRVIFVQTAGLQTVASV